MFSAVRTKEAIRILFEGSLVFGSGDEAAVRIGISPKSLEVHVHANGREVSSDWNHVGHEDADTKALLNVMHAMSAFRARTVTDPDTKRTHPLVGATIAEAMAGLQAVDARDVDLNQDVPLEHLVWSAMERVVGGSHAVLHERMSNMERRLLPLLSA